MKQVSDEQAKQLLAIIAGATIKGVDAVAIVQLQQVLSKPVEEKKK